METEAPDAQDGSAVEVERGWELHETVCLIRNRLHENDLVREAQVDE